MLIYGVLMQCFVSVDVGLFFSVVCCYGGMFDDEICLLGEEFGVIF